MAPHTAEAESAPAEVFSLVKVKEGHPNTVTIIVDGKPAEFELPGEARKIMAWFANHRIGQITPENALLMFLVHHYQSMGASGSGSFQKLNQALVKTQDRHYAENFGEAMRKSGFDDFDKVYAELGIAKPPAEEELAPAA